MRERSERNMRERNKRERKVREEKRVKERRTRQKCKVGANGEKRWGERERTQRREMERNVIYTCTSRALVNLSRWAAYD